MFRYYCVVVVLSILVNGALLAGVGRISGCLPRIWRWFLGIGIAGVYAAASLSSAFAFLGAGVWRLFLMALIGFVSFGRRIKQIMIFILLSFAMEGLAIGAGSGAYWISLASAAMVLGLWAVAFRESDSGISYVPVELRYRGECIRMTALRDTGNTLIDPITGRPVLVLDATISHRLTGLTKQQLRKPVEVMRQPPFPGLRLIPYKTIGQSDGFLLGMRIASAQVGDWKGGLLVALAPEEFNCEGKFQALTGGVVC